MTLLVKSFAGVVLVIGYIYCVKVVPERTSILYVNKEEVSNLKFYITRHGRKSGYYMNLEGSVLRTWNNNITAHLIFYEYLHNEYRRSFVEMHFKVCDLIQKEVYIGNMLKKHGVTCPVLGEYHLINMTVPSENFPYKLPFEKVRVDVFLNTTTTQIMMFRVHLYLHFENK